MLVTEGNIWDYHARGHFICITTNGFIKKSGELVMGAGIARQAASKFYGITFGLGAAVKLHGNVPLVNRHFRLITFPTKHSWMDDKSSLDLIQTSAKLLVKIADVLGSSAAPTHFPIFMPIPGTGNGKLSSEIVLALLKPILDDRFNALTYQQKKQRKWSAWKSPLPTTSSASSVVPVSSTDIFAENRNY